MKDLLDEATEALREETGAERNPETLERALAARRRGKVRSLRWLAWPLAATLVVLTALAGASGKLGRVLSVLGFDHASEETGAAGSGPSAAIAMPTVTPTAPSASPSLATASPEPPVPTVPTSRPSAQASGPASIPAAVLPAPSGSAKESPDELYRRASQAHFVDHDYGRAVGLWDRYLLTGGPLALEARYNRAVALLRAGRTAEARAALTPFAAGEYGAYRKQEAQALLDTLPPR
jgi:hypothetical protein